ncbi:MAG: hypothetical protein ACRC57_10880 [Sarcina sp.]
MGIMQKEVKTHKKSVAIVESVVLVSIMIFISQIIGSYKLKNIKLAYISDPIFLLTTAIIILVILKNCRTSYKYSVISDQLIVHKLVCEKQKILENIRVADIIYLGKEKKEIKKIKTIFSRRYMCSLYDSEKYCCIYNKNGVNHKFYFQASDEFVNRVKKLKVSIDKHSA